MPELTNAQKDVLRKMLDWWWLWEAEGRWDFRHGKTECIQGVDPAILKPMEEAGILERSHDEDLDKTFLVMTDAGVELAKRLREEAVDA